MNTLSDTSLSSCYLVSRGNQNFGLPVENVMETVNFERVTHVPASISELVGVVSLRSQILPVLLPDRWFNTGRAPFDPDKPILVLKVGEVVFSIQFDEVLGVVQFDSDSVFPHPEEATSGVFHKLVYLSDGRLFSAINAEALVQQIETVSV